MEIIAPVSIDNEATWGTRGSSATYWDRNGVLQTAATNALRVTYDPADLTAAPYPLIESSPATNLYLYSEDFTQSSWNKSGCSIVPASAIAPNGENTASKLVEGTGTGAYLFQAVNAVAGNKVTIQVFAKLGVGDRGIALVFTNTAVGTNQIISFDLSTLEPTVIAGTPTYAATILENGYAWLSATVPVVADGTVSTQIRLTKSKGITYTGDGASYNFVWGAMCSIGEPSSYIKTTNAAVTRAADVLSSNYGLLYSNLLENDTDDAPLWVSGQAVAKDAYRRRTETHKVYKALQAVPTSVTTTPELNPLDANGNPYWLEWGPTNRWGVLDADLDTQSVGNDVLQWVVRPGELANTLTVHAADASDVRVSMVSANGLLVYRQTKKLLLKTSRTWSDWFYKTRERRPDEIFRGMPYLKTALICVTITKLNSLASAGAIKMGRIEDIGETLVEPEVRTLRNSVIKNDGYGRWKFNKRPSNKIMSANVWLDASRMDAVIRLVDRHTAEPCVIIGDDRWSSLILLGYFDDFAVILNDGNSANYNLKAIGLA